MKKIIIILFILTIVNLVINTDSKIEIPSNAIRFRIIANSNSKEDQALKKIIKNDIEPGLMNKIYQAKSHDEAKKNIISYIPNIDKTMKKYDTSYEINYGNNYFPEKEYKGVTYKAGEYESLVITLGDGLGDNWWCVLFPPLCLLEADENNLEETEYKLYINKIIDSIRN